MKKIISFEKKLEFQTMIGEVTSISLEHTLNFITPSIIEGDFTITGTYKMTEASCIEEKFDFKLPTEIILNEILDITTTKIEINDFYYEIEDDENLICYIDVSVEGVEDIIREEEKETSIQEEPLRENDEVIIDEKRDCDGDVQTLEELQIKEEVIENLIEEKEQIMESEIKEEVQNQIPSLFSSLNDDEDTFTTYSVYILRQEDTVQTILDKYKTTKEKLEDYNDLSNITIGSKIIIPVND